jgi:hypothetical protein
MDLSAAYGLLGAALIFGLTLLGLWLCFRFGSSSADAWKTEPRDKE